MSTYRDAGVDIDAGNRAVELIKPLAESTQGPEVLAGVGPFSGLFALDVRRYQQPVLVAIDDEAVESPGGILRPIGVQV